MQHRASHPAPAPAGLGPASVDGAGGPVADLGVGLDAATDAAVIAGADREQHLFSAHQRAFFSFLVEVDRRRLWETDGCRNITEWISGRYDEPTYKARLWIDAAYALESLPLLSNEFSSGALSMDKTVQLARFATPTTEQDLIRWAKRVTTRTVRRKAEVARRKAEVEAERDAEAALERSRYLSWWPCDDDRAIWIEALLPAAEGMTAIRTIDRLAERKPRDPDLVEDLADRPDAAAEAEARTRDQRRADAFIELCSHALDADFDADRATVVVHAELDALRKDGAGAEIDAGPVVSGSVLRQLACDARVELVLSDAARGVVGIGRASRTPPAWLYRQVLRRDGGCTFPGCGTRRYIAAHHIVHWEDGGPTDLGNLTIACGFHHRLIHTRGWDVKLSGSGEATWFKPDGSIYEPRGPTGAYG